MDLINIEIDLFLSLFVYCNKLIFVSIEQEKMVIPVLIYSITYWIREPTQRINNSSYWVLTYIVFTIINPYSYSIIKNITKKLSISSIFFHSSSIELSYLIDLVCQLIISPIYSCENWEKSLLSYSSKESSL